MTNIHNTPSLIIVYAANVVSALTVYLNALLLVVYLPFQTVNIPAAYGPNWAYVTAGLLVIFQYYLWALEMSGYWFKSESLKLVLLRDSATVDRWKKLNIVWGSALTALTVAIL